MLSLTRAVADASVSVLVYTSTCATTCVVCCCSEVNSGVYEDPEAVNGHTTG